MEASNVWEYLDNVWVLTGLVLVVFTGLLKLLPVERISSQAAARLIDKGMNYTFILGLVSIVLGFVISQNNDQAPGVKSKVPIAVESTQIIDGNIDGTAINAGGNVNFNQPQLRTQDRTGSDNSSRVNQQIKNNSGIAINSGRDASAVILENNR